MQSHGTVYVKLHKHKEIKRGYGGDREKDRLRLRLRDRWRNCERERERARSLAQESAKSRANALCARLNLFHWPCIMLIYKYLMSMLWFMSESTTAFLCLPMWEQKKIPSSMETESSAAYQQISHVGYSGYISCTLVMYRKPPRAVSCYPPCYIMI